MLAALVRTLALTCLLALSQAASAAELAVPKPLPKFADYPAEVFRGRMAKPILDDEWLQDRPELIEVAMKKRVMVAGHYVLAITTCGSTCQQPLLIDAKTGKVLSLPSVSGWRKFREDFNPVLTRPNSRLIVLQGGLDEKHPVGVHYFAVENGEPKLMHTTDTDGDFRKTPKL
jgi:hypothetical protein